MSFARIAVWCLICLYLWPQASWCEDRSPQTQSRAKLHQVFSDDFSKDSLSGYQMKGEPAWETGLLRLPEGSSVSRPVELGSRVVVTAELQFPVLTKDGEQSRTMLRIELNGATPCFVAWQQTRNEGKTSSRLFILDILPKDGKSTLKVVRSLAVDGPLELAAWSVDYHHGLLRISRGNEIVLAGYIENGAATVGSISWIASLSEIDLRRLAVDGLNPPAPLTAASLTESQLKSAADANKKNAQLVQLYRQGKLAEAAELGETILGIRRKVLGVDHSDYATSLNSLAMVYYELGQYPKAEPLFRERCDVQKRVLGVEHPDYASTLNTLASVYYKQGKYGKAEPLYLEARDIRKRVLGVDHPDYATSLNSLASVYYLQLEYAKAEPLLLETLDIRKRVLGVEHPHYASTLNTLASVYYLQLEYAKAEPLLLETLDIRKRVLGVEHPDYASTLNTLASVYYKQGEYGKAEPLYLEARDIRKRVLGVEHPDYATSLNNLASLYESQGEYAKAEPLFLEARDIRKRVLGVDHPNYATSLNNLAALYLTQGESAKAEPLFLEARDIRKRVLGVEHPDYASTLNTLAVLYGKQAEYTKAEPLLLEARDIRKRVLGVDHPDYAGSLNSLAKLYYKQGEYAKAEPLFLEARDIRKRVQGVEHPDYATSLNNLAELYHSQGKYGKAEPLLLEARDIRKRVLGVDHPNYAASLNSLAGLYDSQGESAKAEPLYLEARDIYKRVLGVEHPDYAMSLGNLAVLYSNQGEYAKAEPLYLEARDINKRVLGVEHPSYAMSLGNLAVLYSNQGEYAKAEPLYLEARDINKRVLGVEHPSYAMSLNNLAMLYIKQAEYGKAEPLYLEARDIRKRVLGVEHPDYATSLNNLAGLYSNQGEYAKAEPLYLEALDIRKRVLGVEHPSYAASLNNLAGLYSNQGEYAKAEPLYLEARDINKRVLGVEHPSYAMSLNNLASPYWSQGEYAKAEPLLLESLKLSRDLIERNAVGQSQSTQLKYSATLRSRLDALLSHGLASSAAGTDLFDEILSWKGMTLVRQRKYRLAGEDARTRPILESLTSTSRQLTAVLRKTPTPNTQKAWRQQVAALSEKRDRLEAELAAASPEIQQASERLTTEDLLEILPEGTVLVDFLSFQFFQRVPKEDYHVLKPRRHVLASILRKGRPVEFVNLGPEADINQAVKQWRTVFLSRNPNDAVGVEPAGRKLRQQIWKPLLPHLQDARTVILCPDGALGRVAFVALPGREKGSYLIEDHRLACVPVPQLLPALFRKVSADQRLAGDALLIGDVDYSATTREQATPKKNKRPGSEELFRDVAFVPLDETAGEIAAIRDLFFDLFDAEPDAVRTLRKQQATESAFRQYAGKYETLHIATHGFFADASKKSAEQSAAAETRAGSRSGLFGQNDNAMTHVTGFHPGMLSGLALAGANHAPEADGDDDGILTADEISFLRLEGVDLVVLSACETGLGEVAGGEGLLGVQRAFQVSGARSVLASLWSVDDVATRRLMDRFYRNLWNKKMTRLDALREAQLWMLKNPGSIEGSIVRGSLVRLKKPPKPTSPKPDNTTGRTNPRFWAAFTLSGDWR